MVQAREKNENFHSCFLGSFTYESASFGKSPECRTSALSEVIPLTTLPILLKA